jgi:chaperone modulatory protein CbpM
MAERSEAVTAEILDETHEVTLVEVSRFCLVREERVIAMVEEGILQPTGEDPAHWRFPAASMLRARKALKLAHEFEIELPAVALVLDLLDEIEMLRRRSGAR